MLNKKSSGSLDCLIAIFNNVSIATPPSTPTISCTLPLLVPLEMENLAPAVLVWQQQNKGGATFLFTSKANAAIDLPRWPS